MMNNMPNSLENLPKSNPFVVPEGYFDNLTARVMDKLPESDATINVVMKPRRNYFRIALSTAAVACFAVFGAVVFWQKANQNEASDAVVAANVDASDDAEQSADYIIMDNEMLYSYLSEY